MECAAIEWDDRGVAGVVTRTGVALFIQIPLRCRVPFAFDFVALLERGPLLCAGEFSLCDYPGTHLVHLSSLVHPVSADEIIERGLARSPVRAFAE